MRFEQYQMLKQNALAACEAAGAKFPDVGQMNPIVLAYVGDVVFSMYVRLRLLPTSGQVRVLHDLGSKMVSAVCRIIIVVNCFIVYYSITHFFKIISNFRADTHNIDVFIVASCGVSLGIPFTLNHLITL